MRNNGKDGEQRGELLAEPFTVIFQEEISTSLYQCAICDQLLRVCINGNASVRRDGEIMRSACCESQPLHHS